MRIPFWSPVLTLFALVCTVSAAAVAEDHKNMSALAAEDINSAAAANVNTTTAAEPKFLGLYAADGHFQAPGRITRYASASDDPSARIYGRSAYVPPWVDLHSIESVIEDLAPPARPRKVMRGKSVFAALRDSIITAAYGHEQVLLAPSQITSDSRQRVIIIDPLQPWIHVLDGKQSFRIVGGAGHRILRPTGIAVDNQDNIYVADGQQGFVLVYDSEGRYLRSIGDFHGERMFQGLTGITIDPRTNRLYVLDSPSNEIVVLDLTGKAVKRIGGIHNRNTNVKFEFPTAVAVGVGSIVVVDNGNSRIQVLSLDGQRRSEFFVSSARIPGRTGTIGIALDSTGKIYASDRESATVRIFNESGKLIGTLGQTGVANAEWGAPAGVWIDRRDRIYVADSKRAAVHVFQAAPTAASGHP